MTRCQSDSEADVTESAEEVSDLGIVGEDAQYFGDGNFSPAPGVDSVCVFPKNSARCRNFIYLLIDISVFTIILRMNNLYDGCVCVYLFIYFGCSGANW